ncbi:MAG: glucosamine-6-phosphate deaminase [Acetanaerobacterium sp.]
MPRIKEFNVDRLMVKSYDSRLSMGAAAAQDIAAEIQALLHDKDEISMIFAAAPSQSEMLEALCTYREIPWNRVNAFHMDEYRGLSADAPQSFGSFLKEWVFGRLPFQSVNYINGGGRDSEAECARYSALLCEHPVDIVCMGIGENGHIAFNDPPVADFNDPVLVKEVTLDAVCREQQVHDGCFACLEDVPRQALTLTVPALMQGGALFCVVPAATKAQAVHDMLLGAVDEHCPASVLRGHGHAQLYLDNESSGLIHNIK